MNGRRNDESSKQARLLGLAQEAGKMRSLAPVTHRREKLRRQEMRVKRGRVQGPISD